MDTRGEYRGVPELKEASVQLAVITHEASHSEIAGSLDTWAGLSPDELSRQLQQTPLQEIVVLVGQAHAVTDDYRRRMIATSELPGRIAEHLELGAATIRKRENEAAEPSGVALRRER